MLPKKHKRLYMISAIITMIIVGCAPPYKTPDFTRDGFKSGEIDSLYVMPVLDFRIDKKEKLPLDEWVHEFIKIPLENKNYSIVIVKERSLVADIQQEKLKDSSPLWIANMGPIQSRWLFFIALHDLTSKMTFGSTGNAEMSGYIFDKQRSILIWRNKVIAQVGQGGLLGMLMLGEMEREAVLMATIELIKGLPIRDKGSSIAKLHNGKNDQQPSDENNQRLKADDSITTIYPEQNYQNSLGIAIKQEDPRTGEWSIQGYQRSCTFLLRQNGIVVKSTNDSKCKLAGKVEGEILTGWIEFLYKKDDFRAKMSSNKQSFNGEYLHGFSAISRHIWGKKKK